MYYADSIMNYNFTDNISKAFGNNMVLKGTKYCIYSGDLNNDGYVNLEDILICSNASASFPNGYFKEDINGDKIVDLNDVIITYNNSGMFVSKEVP